MRDSRLLNVSEEVRRLMREFSDSCFDGESQDVIDAKWREYKEMKDLDKEGVMYVPKF